MSGGWGAKVIPPVSGSSPSLDVRPINVSTYRISYPTVGVELSQALPNNTSIIYLNDVKSSSKMKVSFTLGGTLANDFVTVQPGNSFYVENVNLSGKILYFNSNRSGIIEIQVWYK